MCVAFLHLASNPGCCEANNNNKLYFYSTFLEPKDALHLEMGLYTVHFIKLLYRVYDNLYKTVYIHTFTFCKIARCFASFWPTTPPFFWKTDVSWGRWLSNCAMKAVSSGIVVMRRNSACICYAKTKRQKTKSTFSHWCNDILYLLYN